MEKLLRRLKVEMNGAVVDAMEARGICYPLSYGVSVPTIREIARAQAPSHSLALLLFDRGVRELMLSACYIDRPEWVTPDQMRAWSRSFANTEIAEHAAMLFSGAPEAFPMALEWLADPDAYRVYAALLMVARFSGDLLSEASRSETLVEAIDRALSRDELPTYLLRAAAGALCRCAGASGTLLSRIRALCETYAASDRPALREMGEALSWQLDYLT